MQSRFSRRSLIQAGALAAGGTALAAVSPVSGIGGRSGPGARYGGLQPDPGGLLDLPPGFSYGVLASEGDLLPSGMTVPGHPDGAAAFPWPGGGTVLVRNHELDVGKGPPVEGKRRYDSGYPGGTTAIVVDADRKVTDQFVASSGTINNCSGGATPWGTWLTCEEDLTGGFAVEGHGYVFEVDPASPEDELSRTPIRDMGFFSHEALAIDPGSGVVYMTEDDFRGKVNKADPNRDTRSAFFYRYLPTIPALARARFRPAASCRPGGRGSPVAEHGLRRPKPPPAGDLEDDRSDRRPQRRPLEGLRPLQSPRGLRFSGGAVWFSDTVGGEPPRAGLPLRARHRDTGAVHGGEPREADAEPRRPHRCALGRPALLRGRERRRPPDGHRPEGSVYELASNGLGSASSRAAASHPTGDDVPQHPGAGITFAVWAPSRRPTRLASAASPPARRESSAVSRSRGGGVRASQRPRPPRSRGVPEPLRAAALKARISPRRRSSASEISSRTGPSASRSTRPRGTPR